MTGRISKSVGGLIGLGQEAYQHHQEKKNAPTTNNPEDDLNAVSDNEHDEDEDDWVADDVQAQLDQPETAGKSDSKEDFVESFLKRHPPPSPPISHGRLPAPVIIPQKRPDMRSRGFVKAYAPALAESGVDQQAFLEFLDGFHEEIKGHGYFNATNIAIALSVMTYTISIAPSAVVHFTALAVHTSIEAGRRLYISKKSNSYIDEINMRYFRPRGLYAMIMTYKPGSKEESETLDFESAAATAVDTRKKEGVSSMQNYKASSGKMLEQQLPECCPLVFPALDKASNEEKENAFKRSLAFTRDYYDRRGQAEFKAENPDSQLNVPQKEFSSQHGDPKSYSNSGLLGVVTGGRIDPRQRRFERINRRRENLGMKQKPSGGRQGVLLGKGGLVKKSLGEHVLYLMIVNMPTEEELQAAKNAEERMKREQPNWFEKLAARGST